MAGRKRLPWHAAGERGFTLLETMIALAIVVFVFASVIAVEGASISALERTKRMNTAVMLAKQAMTEAEMEVEGKPLRELENTKSGTFDAPYEEFRWTREIKEVEFPDIMGQAPAGGEDGDGTGTSAIAETLGKVMTGFLSDALREMTVTVYWPRGEGEQSFSVSTWLVDLNSEMRINP